MYKYLPLAPASKSVAFVFPLVPTLQRGNAYPDAPASSLIIRVLFILSLLFLTACKEEKATGAGTVRWDREICARCAMAISDPNYSAQIRGGKAEKKAKLYKFDDIGCAIIWLDDQKWKDDARTEIWVNHYKTGEWINAKTAWYIKIENTPMDYGLGAQTEKVDGALNYEQAKAHIYEVEKRFNQHTANPLETIEPALPSEEKQ